MTCPEEDPLDAYMNSLQQQIDQDYAHAFLSQNTNNNLLENPGYSSSDEESAFEIEQAKAIKALGTDPLLVATPQQIMAMAQKKAKKRDLLSVDHNSIEYEPFRKDFYTETTQLQHLSEEQVRRIRQSLNNMRVKGHNVPKPFLNWTQCGLSQRMYLILKFFFRLDILKAFLKFDHPTPIQSQAIPAMMSGRDVIGIARTGSGKTIAYLLPLFRHVRDQRPVSPSEGPIALVLTPTRELAIQVGSETKKLAHAFGVRVVCAYGGSSIKDQIGELKRGAEILISTPGRLIDLLTANAGRILNLRRVTFVIIDEADRMFDMGFEPQITRIMELIRPDRQIGMFSATFPKAMEQLAKRISNHPIEIMVGGRSTVNMDIIQDIRIVPEEKKFFLLLDILGKWSEENVISNYSSRSLIFVDRQDDADLLFKDLVKKGHVCIAIHGGKDQSDRDSALVDFKSGAIPILVATSVAARGLDVRELNLVINYDCPNHMEDYVHRVGRTGRAGNKGTAITFITPEQERYAVDLVRALSTSNATVPEPLSQMAKNFMDRVKKKETTYQQIGYGGKGLEKIEAERDKALLVQKSSFGEQVSDEENEPSQNAPIDSTEEPQKKVKLSFDANMKLSIQDSKQLLEDIAQKINTRLQGSATIQQSSMDQLKVGQELFAQLTSSASGDVVQMCDGDKTRRFKCEIDINDYPQYARWRVTSKDVMMAIQESCYCSMVVRGTHIPPNKAGGLSGERRLHLVIEGDNELSVLKARKELLELIIDATSEALIKGASTESSRYTLL